MSFLEAIGLQSILTSLIIAFAVRGVVNVVWRAYFGPLSKIPGPRLAALTPLYEAYFDVIKQGRYTWKISKLHEKYGECSLHDFTTQCCNA